MSIISLILMLVVIGFCLWLLLTYVPLPPPLKQIIIAIVAIAAVLWILSATGIYRQSWLHL